MRYIVFFSLFAIPPTKVELLFKALQSWYLKQPVMIEMCKLPLLIDSCHPAPLSTS